MCFFFRMFPSFFGVCVFVFSRWYQNVAIFVLEVGGRVAGLVSLDGTQVLACFVLEVWLQVWLASCFARFCIGGLVGALVGFIFWQFVSWRFGWRFGVAKWSVLLGFCLAVRFLSPFYCWPLPILACLLCHVLLLLVAMFCWILPPPLDVCYFALDVCHSLLLLTMFACLLPLPFLRGY